MRPIALGLAGFSHESSRRRSSAARKSLSRQRKRVVVHVFGRMDYGGAQLRTVEFLRLNVDQDFEFHFITLAPGPGTLDEVITGLGGYVHSCPLRGRGFGRHFRRLIHGLGADVVHSHVHHFSGYLLRLAAKESVPTRIAHFRSTGDGQPVNLRRRLQRLVMKHWIDRYATAIAAVGAGAMEAAWSKNWPADSRCRVLFSGIDLALFEAPADRAAVRQEFGLPADAVLVVHVGLLCANKNQSRLVDIFDHLRRLDARARLILVGRDSDGTAARLRGQIDSLALTPLVSIAGERTDVARLLKAADVMIFPSKREGLPGAILEACAAGTPVVTGDLPGALEIQAACSLVTCLPAHADDRSWAVAAASAAAGPRQQADLAGGQFDSRQGFAALLKLYQPAVAVAP